MANGDHGKLEQARDVPSDVRRRITGGSVVIAGSVAAIVCIVVVSTLKRKPMYGWWPVAIGAVFMVAAVVWSWWYARHRFFYAEYGVAATATVVHIKPAGRHSPRKVTFEHAYRGILITTSRNEPLRWREGNAIAILVDPRDPTAWVERNLILNDHRAP